MAHQAPKRVDYEKRPPAESIIIIKTDGTVIRADDAFTRLNRLIDLALGDEKVTPRAIGRTPVELSNEDAPVFTDEIKAALAFARRAS